MSDVIGSLWDHLNSVRLWIGSALIVIGRLLMETVSAIPVNRWLVREAKQREHYITEMEETAERRISERDRRITELQTNLELLTGSSSSSSPTSIPTLKVRRSRKPVKPPSDKNEPT